MPDTTDSAFPFPVARFTKYLSFMTLNNYLVGDDVLARFDMKMRSGVEMVEVFPTQYQLGGVAGKVAMFDVDDIFYYTSFAEDHGPFNLGLVARFRKSID